MERNREAKLHTGQGKCIEGIKHASNYEDRGDVDQNSAAVAPRQIRWL
jgi:hypothetical protein